MLVYFEPTINLSCLKATAPGALLAGSTQLIWITSPKVKSLPSRQITQCSLSHCSDNCCSPLWSKSSAHATLTTHSCTYSTVIFVLKEEEVNCRHSIFYSKPLSLLTSIKLQFAQAPLSRHEPLKNKIQQQYSKAKREISPPKMVKIWPTLKSLKADQSWKTADKQYHYKQHYYSGPLVCKRKDRLWFSCYLRAIKVRGSLWWNFLCCQSSWKETI